MRVVIWLRKRSRITVIAYALPLLKHMVCVSGMLKAFVQSAEAEAETIE